MTFTQLTLNTQLQHALEYNGFTTLTPIQEKSLPLLLEGKDIIAQAPTGSGKTLSFALTILEHIAQEKAQFQALVLVPTRELAKQIAAEIQKLSFKLENFKSLVMIGGEPLRIQKSSLDQGVHIVIATPGRVMDFIGKEMIDFSNVSHLVVDEADRMFDMGFADDIHSIVYRLKAARQSMLFSATFDEKVIALGEKILKAPTKVKIESDEETLIEELFVSTKNSTKEQLLFQTLAQFRPQSTLIFCNTKEQCKRLEADLLAKGLDALALHGDLDQMMREEALYLFESGSINILIATDVASRGLDIDDLALVINFDLPHDAELYTHRIGRTGRNQKKGRAVSFFKDQYQLDKIFKTPRTFELMTLDAAAKPFSIKAEYKTFLLFLGKKEKIRKGDILGSLCGDAGLDGDVIGKIKVEAKTSFVTIKKSAVSQARHFFETGKVKGKRCKAKLL